MIELHSRDIVIKKINKKTGAKFFKNLKTNHVLKIKLTLERNCGASAGIYQNSFLVVNKTLHGESIVISHNNLLNRLKGFEYYVM